MFARTGQRGYSTVLWAGFLAFCMLPLLALSINVGRWFYARGAVAQAADAAALAAVQEVDVPTYITTGVIVLKPSAWGIANNYASLNTVSLGGKAMRPYVSGITVDQGSRTVRVTVSATVENLVPWSQTVTLTATGEAQVRGRTAP